MKLKVSQNHESVFSSKVEVLRTQQRVSTFWKSYLKRHKNLVLKMEASL